MERRSICTALTLLSGLIPLASLAAGSSSVATDALKRLSVEELMDLEVTSVSRRPEKLQEVPSAIQVITGEDVARAGAASVPEALRLASNLEVAQIDSHQWAISARGFNNTLANKMLVLIDGRTVYTPLYAGVYWDVQDTLLEDIDRIEVISGPGATQWGANAVNGVINIVTKSAQDTPGTLFSAGGGTEQRGFGGVRFGGEIAEGLHWRVYGKYLDRDDAVLPNGQGAGDSWHTAQGGFRLDSDEDSRNHLTVQGDLYDGSIAQLATADVEVNGLNLLGRWSRTLTENADLTLQAYYDRTHRDLPNSIVQDLDTYDLDFQHRLPLGSRHDFVWGLSYRLVDDDIAHPTTFAFLPSQVRHKWFGGFVQDEIMLFAQQLYLTLGTKLEHNDYTGLEVQPSMRIAWRPSASRTIWSAISRAVRTPSRIDVDFYAPATPPFTLLQGGPDFVSEQLLAYELGYREQSNRQLAFSLATFYNEYDDLRSVEPVTPPAAFPIVLANGLRGESYGAELTADYRANENWRVHFGYTELRAHSAPKPGSLDRTSTRSVALDPHRQALVRASFDLTGHVDLNATLRYTASIAIQNVPAYTTFDLSMGWRPEPAWELRLVGQNLLDEQHPEFGAAPTRREIERGVYAKVLWRY